MTAEEQPFLRELEIFRRECESSSQYLYAYLAIHDVAKRRKAVFRALDRHALFWNTVAGALQGSAIIALGRVFDQGTPHNVDVLLRLAQRNPGMFTRVSLATRKSNGAAAPPPWLSAFIDQVQEPTVQDFRKLRAQVSKFRQVYEQRFRPLRHSVFAHTLIHGPSEAAPVAAKANINELKRLISSLLSLHEALWQLVYNGRPPVLRRLRCSAKRRKDLGSNDRPHERIVAEAEEVLVAAARPNNDDSSSRPVTPRSPGKSSWNRITNDTCSWS